MAPPLHQRALNLAFEVANGRNTLSRLIPPLLLLVDAAICGLAIWKVPYTEIDWVAYMQQVSQFVSGERDYTKIAGDTGPLVYPATHLYIYLGLYHLTDEGRDIFVAQHIFAALYLMTLAIVMVCYWKARVPPYVFPLLILSKRLHSIFVLRCFNDCFAVFFLWLSIYFFQRRRWNIGAVMFSFGLGTKMSLLLVLPAVGTVLALGAGLGRALRSAFLIAEVQVAIAVPFLTTNILGYFSRAFELSRVFLFKWTVNWRFVGEEAFLSPAFAIGLLALHATVLGVFALTRWLGPTRRDVSETLLPLMLWQPPFTKEEEVAISKNVTPRYITTTILSANVIGLLFARSLHYQFYAYVAWSTPFLLWRSGLHPVLQYFLWFAQEVAWNVYPSTPISSAVVVGVLALTVVSVWWGTSEDDEPLHETGKSEADKR